MNIASHQACVQNKHCYGKTYWLLTTDCYSPSHGSSSSSSINQSINQSSKQASKQSTKQAINRPCGYASCPAWVPRMITWDNGLYAFASQTPPQKKKHNTAGTCNLFFLDCGFHTEKCVFLSHQHDYIFSWNAAPRCRIIKKRTFPPTQKKICTPPKTNIGPGKLAIPKGR